MKNSGFQIFQNTSSYLFAILITLFSCSPQQFAFTKKAFEPQTDCPKISCSLPFQNGCRFEKPTFDSRTCQTSCGNIVCDAPSTPQLKSLEQELNSTVLKWAPLSSPGKISYKVIREIGAAKETKNISETQNSDSSLSYGKEHFYSVIAVSEYGESKPSDKKSIVPIEPFLIEKKLIESGSVQIQWKKVLGAESYQVKTGNNPNALSEIGTASFSESNGMITAKITGLTNGVVQYFQVNARNPKVNRLSDNILTLIPYDGFQLTSRSAGDQFAKLGWSELKGASQYKLEYWLESQPSQIFKIDNISAVEKVVSNLQNGNVYVFRVCGYLVNDCVPSTNTLKAEPISPPVIAAVAGYKERVEVSWNAVTGTSVQYQVAVSKNGVSLGMSALSSALKSSHALSAVGESHQFVLTASNANGGVSVSTPKEGIPLGAFKITKLTPSSSSLQLEYESSKGSNQYTVFYKEEGGTEKSLSPSASLNAVINSLTNGKKVSVYVRANRTGQEGYVDSDSLSALPRGEFKLISAQDGLLSILLSWESLAGATAYEVFIKNKTLGETNFTIQTTLNANTFTIPSLLKENNYELKVNAKLSDGTSVVSQNTLEAIPYGSFAITSATSGVQTALIAWENYFSGTKYDVYYWESSLGETTKVLAPNSTPLLNNIAIDSLKENVKYKFRVIANIGNHHIPAASDVEVLSKANPIKRFKPALAVRGLNCMMCHASISSNIITDLGVGSANFVPRNQTDWNQRNTFLNNVEHAYSNQREAFQSAHKIEGQIIVPRLTIPKDDLSFLYNEEVSNRFPSGVSIIDLFKNEDLGGSGTMLKNVTVPTGSEKIIEKSNIVITYPTKTEILNLVPVGGRTLGSINPVNSEYSQNSKLTGLKVFGSSPEQVVLSHDVSSTVECTGDVVIVGTLVLRNTTIKTDSKGCRLYVTGSVFIQGEIPLISTESGKRPNLQITSARAILMGLSHLGMAGKNPSKDFKTTNRENSTGNVRGFDQGSHTRYGERMNTQYNPSRGDVNGESDANFFDGIVDEARVVETFANIELIDAADIFKIQSAQYPGTEAVNEGRHLKANYEGLLLNAPHVHSRYFGDFKGVIVADMAFMGRNASPDTINEEFHYDDVFDSAPLMLPLLPRAPVQITD